ELDGGDLQLGALRDAVPLGEGTGGDVADDDFQRDDRNLLDNRLAVGELFNKVGRDAGLFKLLHHEVRHLVADDAFSDDGALFGAVEGGRVVLVVDDDEVRVRSRENLFGLAFIELL